MPIKIAGRAMATIAEVEAETGLSRAVLTARAAETKAHVQRIGNRLYVDAANLSRMLGVPPEDAAGVLASIAGKGVA